MKKFYITTPIYYVNSPPHVGSAYTTIAADILARYHGLKNENVFFLTGTDEHGKKVQQTAQEAGIPVKEFVDKIAHSFKETWRILNVSYNNFIRTTDVYHKNAVKRILQKLYKDRFIYKGYYESYYCIGCEQYLTKTDLVDGKCPLHKKEPELKKEQAYLFKLSKFQNKILTSIKEGRLCILPIERRNEVISFIENGLQDISISRKKSEVPWGIELPFDKEHSCYVWIDAFYNYASGLKNKYRIYWPPDIQLMAKDILRVHATIWIAINLALRRKLPKMIFVHGYFTINGQKISKSLGNAIDPIYLLNRYGVDALRYYLIREIPFGQDGDFSEESLKSRLNNELANDLGNLVSRILTLVEKNFKNGLKKNSLDKRLAEKLNIKKIDSYMENLELHNALSEIWKFINECNKHINEEKPWEMKNAELKKHLYTLTEAIRIISILISPFMPTAAEKISKQLNIKLGKLRDAKFGLIKTYNVKKGEILFKKI